MDLASLIRQSHELAVEYGDEPPLHLTYAPQRLDGAMMLRLGESEAGTLTERTNAMVAVLAELLTGWDLTDDGAAVVLDAEALLSLPFALLSQIANTIVADTSSGKARTPSSNGTSPRPAAGQPRRR